MIRTLLFVCLAACVLPVFAEDSGYACLIEPNQKIEIRSPVEALIDKILVDRGAYVKQGDVLVQLDTGVEEANRAVAKYRATMEGQVRSAESRLNYAKEKLRRREELSRENYISAQDRDDASNEMQVAESDLLEANDNRELASLDYKRLTAVVEERYLRSPFNGVVMDRMQQPGELARTGDNAQAILRLAQIDPLRVEVILPVSLYGTVKVGMKGEVVPEAPLTGRYTATVKIVDKVIDSASGTFGVRLELPNTKRETPAGVKCRVSFHK